MLKTSPLPNLTGASMADGGKKKNGKGNVVQQRAFRIHKADGFS